MRNTFFAVSVLVLCGIADTRAEESGFRFSGYIKNHCSDIVADRHMFSDVATARIEGYWDYGRRAGIETHVLLTSALQPLDPYVNVRDSSAMAAAITTLTRTLMEQMDTSVLSMFEGAADQHTMDYLPYSSMYQKDNVTLDRALIKYYFSVCDLYVGRQMIAWGTGYAFNPTDIWNRKSPLDPNAPKKGVNAVRTEIPLGSLSGLSLVVSPGPDVEHTGAGMRLKTYLKGFDLSMCAMRIHNADRGLLGLPEKMTCGMDMAGQLGDVGVWSEVALHNPVYPGQAYSDFDSLYAQIDAGADYTFENGVYILGEYLYNGLGEERGDNYGMQQLLRILGGDMSGFGMHYGMAGIKKTLLDFYTPSLFILVNASDRSAMLLPSFEYMFSDNLVLEASARIGIADSKNTEYGSLYPGISFKATGYF